MRVLNILETIHTNLTRPEAATKQSIVKQKHTDFESSVFALTEKIYAEMLVVLDSLSQIRQESYDLALVKTHLISPIAYYLVERSYPADEPARFVKPLFLSGVPGIGKTTMIMVLDEALWCLNLSGLGSCRDLVVSEKLTGYFAEKPALHITPLALFGKRTAVLSVRDWNNILRFWTFDESIARHSELALRHLVQKLQGKVVFADEAELEGYVYFSQLLGQHGVLVVLSSNVATDQIHLAADRVRPITLHGSDHRQGDISNVCLPNAPHELFDQFEQQSVVPQGRYGGKTLRHGNDGKTLLYLNWQTLANKPFMKDDFAHCFADYGAEAVLLDEVPFFRAFSKESVDLTFLGYLARFVNFVDAVHDSQLPLLIRGTQAFRLDPLTAGSHLRPLLIAFDQGSGGHYGQTAWIEWTRCLSRLRSRDAINTAFQ